jgi:hypothetical protein
VEGGTGTMTGGSTVTVASTAAGTLDPLGNPMRVHHNLIYFSPVNPYGSDLTLNGIITSNRRVQITDNWILGTTNKAAVVLEDGVIERNTVTDHTGSYVFGVFGGGTVVRDNRIYRYEPKEALTTGAVVRVLSATNDNVRDVLITGNVMTNNLTGGGALTTGQAKIRFVNIIARGALTDVEVSRNRARNLSRGIVTTGTVDILLDLDNDWLNEDSPATAVTDTTTSVTTKSVRKLPTAGNQHGFSLSTITGAATISTNAGEQIVLIDTGGLPTLATAVGCTSRITVKNRTGAGVLVATTSSQTIDGVSAFTLPAGQSITVVADSTNNWSVV